MRRYFTGIVPSRDEPRLRSCCGRGWRAFTCPASDETRKSFAGSPTEIVIEASNASNAQRALSLIQTAHELLEGAPNSFGISLKVIPVDPLERKQLYPNPLFDRESRISMGGFPEACRLAAKASMKRAYMYAFALYHVSQSLHANHPMDLEYTLRPDQRRSPLPHDHVRFAYSIVTAYAVLEQLGLALHEQIFANGRWIPEKKKDLEARLTRAGINLSKPGYWLLRGGRTRLELRRRLQGIKKAKWSGGKVRDVEIEVVDAVADLRWVRSRVAAHDVKDMASQISIFDVANAQYLARRCILACLGLEPK
jgi:hypothetical protein